jgi:hypothetical protein
VACHFVKTPLSSRLGDEAANAVVVRKMFVCVFVCVCVHSSLFTINGDDKGARS